LDENSSKKIEFEMTQIDRLLSEAKPLLDLCKLTEPDFIEKSAAGLCLHSFYNGIENMLLLIMKEKDGKLPNGQKWHQELLDRAFEKTETRKEIFSKENEKRVNDYLLFRHFIRHNYGFKLDWEQMKGLVTGIGESWNNIKAEIQLFIENN
jgi:hypothetical protein